MSHAVVTVDGQTLMDDNLDRWQQRSPEMFADMIKPGYTPMPWMRAALILLSDALLRGQSIAIHILTRTDGGFNLDVSPT